MRPLPSTVFFSASKYTEHTLSHTQPPVSILSSASHCRHTSVHHLLWLMTELDECVGGFGAVITVVVPGIITHGDLLNLLYSVANINKW